MIKGIHLTLMIGPAVPIPVPRDVLEALTAVEVNTYSGDVQSGFKLTFTLSKRSPLHTLFLLSGGASIPLVRVILVVTFNGLPNVLIDGLMTDHQVQLGSGGNATLQVMGKDLSAALTIFPFDGFPFPAMPPAARVLLIVAKYAWLGILPKVVPSIIEEPPLPTEHIPRQQGKDLDYVQRLARDVGYVFYMEPGPVPGVSFAYWGPEIRVGLPQKAISFDFDAHTNVGEAPTFRFDKEKKEMPIVFIQNQATGIPIPIPIPDITPLNPPLGLVPPLPPKLTPLDYTANLSPLQAALRGVAYASQHADAVFASGSLDVLRYGAVLKSRQLIGVRGAGAAFDGLYYVKSVTHNIKRGEYKQNYELVRNGLISTLPTVPV